MPGMKRFLHLCWLLYAAIALSGCELLWLGAAAGGGYYVGQDDRQVGTIANDGTITMKVNSKFIGDSMISTFDIDVDTHNGVVTLTGNVANQQVAERAVMLARSVYGVRDVINNLRVGGVAPANRRPVGSSPPPVYQAPPPSPPPGYYPPPGGPPSQPPPPPGSYVPPNNPGYR